MRTLYARNVNDALWLGLQHLKTHGVAEPSRNGPVLVSPTPVTTVYTHPQERVMFSALRNANPFFHAMEAIWMLAGHNDVAFPAHYAAQLQLYSDDNITLNGAYGFRWREHFGYDQLTSIIDELKVNPASRRCVLAMWDANDVSEPLREEDDPITLKGYEGDLKRAIAGGKDVPCNTHCYFRINAGKLDITVCNRSNDAVWGAHGANAVQFSVLQEYIAAAVGVELGVYYQVANNYHVYTDRPDVQALMNAAAEYYPDERYETNGVLVTPVMTTPLGQFENELTLFMSARPPVDNVYANPLLQLGSIMRQAYALYKADQLPEALEYLSHVRHDWAVAGYEWLRRIAVKRAAKGAV